MLSVVVTEVYDDFILVVDMAIRRSYRLPSSNPYRRDTIRRADT